MATKVYIVHLAGQGDVEIKVVDQHTWDWLFDGGTPHQNLVDEFLAQGGDKEEADELETVGVGSGSSDNDRALYAPQSRYNGEIFTGYTIKELNKFLKKHDLEIEEEYEGYIY